MIYLRIHASVGNNYWYKVEGNVVQFPQFVSMMNMSSSCSKFTSFCFTTSYSRSLSISLFLIKFLPIFRLHHDKVLYVHQYSQFKGTQPLFYLSTSPLPATIYLVQSLIHYCQLYYFYSFYFKFSFNSVHAALKL